jgi:hypothetical protein
MRCRTAALKRRLGEVSVRPPINGTDPPPSCPNRYHCSLLRRRPPWSPLGELRLPLNSVTRQHPQDLPPAPLEPPVPRVVVAEPQSHQSGRPSGRRRPTPRATARRRHPHPVSGLKPTCGEPLALLPTFPGRPRRRSRRRPCPRAALQAWENFQGPL